MLLWRWALDDGRWACFQPPQRACSPTGDRVAYQEAKLSLREEYVQYNLLEEMKYNLLEEMMSCKSLASSSAPGLFALRCWRWWPSGLVLGRCRGRCFRLHRTAELPAAAARALTLTRRGLHEAFDGVVVLRVLLLGSIPSTLRAPPLRALRQAASAA